MSDPGNSAPVVSVADFGRGKPAIAARWITELELADKETRAWETRVAAIEKRYRDDRATIQDTVPRRSASYKFNVLWSNVQTLMPAIYARPPKPVVGRRYRDRDPVGRAASQIIERGLSYQVECNDMHETVKAAVQDYLLGGRGTCWLVYEPKFATPEETPELSDASETDAEETDTPEVKAEGDVQVDSDQDNAEVPAYEEVEVDYVFWSDFQHSPARVWKEVRWVARRVFMTRDELQARFKNLSQIEVNSIPLDWKPKHLTDQDVTVEQQAFQRATVWEIWNKTDRKVYWINTEYAAGPLDVRDDPLGLEGFFPCPRPLMATTTNGTLVPVPDYSEYQDQADQLDDLTGRIAMVTKAVKVAGLYPSDERDIARMFSEGVENQLLPVSNWAGLMDKGGLEKAVMLLPVERIASVLRDLTEIRGVIKNDLYEITGIADIIRGSTKATETATAQEIKGRYATMRLSDKQQEVARFVRDILRMMGEIMCEHFSPESLLLMSGYDQSDDPGLEGLQKTIAAIDLLKNEKIRAFRIDIEDESTIATDDAAEKQARVEFLQATGGFLKEAIAGAQQVPEMGPLLAKMLLFGVRGFRAGRDMETAIEEGIAAMEKAQQAAAQQPKPPTPEQIQAQTEQAKLQAEMGKAQLQAQADQENAQAEAFKAQTDLALEKMKMDAAEREAERKHEFDMAKLELEMTKAKFDKEAKDREAEKTDKEVAFLDDAKRRSESEEAQTADFAERLDALEGSLMEMATRGATGQQEMMMHLKALAAPKRIVRGPDGRATGVEAVMPDA